MGRAEDRKTSMHRAGVYAILAPGWGDWHAGQHVRGAGIFLACFVCVAWLSWVGGTLAVELATTGLFEAPGAPQNARPWAVNPALQLVAATLGLIWLWHAGVFTAICAAREAYRLEGRPVERAPWFAVLASVCAPGAGQAYDGRVRFGLGLLVAYLLGYLALLPVLHATLDQATEAARELQRYGGGPLLALAPKIHDLVMATKLHAEFSLPWKLHDLLRAYAIADICALLALPRPGLPGDEFLLEPAPALPGWQASNVARVFGHLALGWLCPGAGQFLQGRPRAGWCFFGLSWGLLLSGSLLLTLDAITIPRLSLLQDVCDVLSIAAGMEACWRMESNS